MDKTVNRKKNSWRHQSRNSAAAILLKTNKEKKITFKNLLLWSGWTDRGETLHVWPSVHEEQKVHTYDIIGHMVWQQYWIYPATYEKYATQKKSWRGSAICDCSFSCGECDGCAEWQYQRWELWELLFTDNLVITAVKGRAAKKSVGMARKARIENWCSKKRQKCTVKLEQRGSR